MSRYEELLAIEKEKREKEAATLKEKNNAILDAAAESAADVYRQEAEQAKLDSRALYDDNAIQDAINRKQIRESLANMGMTDSGLSSSMQTALNIQKSRADNQVRATEQQRIRAAESTIDQIFASNELQKAQKGLEIDQAAEAQATQTATSLYNTEVEAATEASKMALDYQNKRAAMAQSYIQDGANVTEAWALAYEAYPDSSTADGVRYAKFNQLRKDGYSGQYAAAMSQAYANGLASSATEQELGQAMATAMLEEAAKEVQNARFNTSAQISLIKKPSLDEMGEMVDTYTRRFSGRGVSDAGVKYAVAQKVGNTYAKLVAEGDDTAANQVGQTLLKYFDGIYLDVALAYAGLE